MKKTIVFIIIVVIVASGIRAIWYYPLFRRPPVLEMTSDLPVMVPYFRISGTDVSLKRYFLTRDDKKRTFPNPDEPGWSKWDIMHEIYLGQKPGYIKIFIEEKWLFFRKRTVYLFNQTDKTDYLSNQQFMFNRFLDDRKTVQKKYSITFIGDSLTEGYFASDKNHGYASLVCNSAGEKKADQESIFAINGTSVHGYAPGGNKGSIDDILRNKTNLIIIELGTNDFESTSLGEFKVKYATLLDDVIKANPDGKIICLSLWRGFAARRYDEVIYSLAHDKNAIFIYLGDLFENNDCHGMAGKTTYFGKADWFHPSDEGHAEIARRILAAIASMENK